MRRLASHRRWSSLIAPVAMATLGCGAEEPGGEPASRGPQAYVELLGGDTMAVETVTRGAARIEGAIVHRSPMTRLVTYSLDLDEAGNVTKFETEHTTPPENPEGAGPWRATITLAGGVATITREAEGIVDTSSVEVGGLVVPVTGRVPIASGILEWAIGRASGATEAIGFNVLSPWGGTPEPQPNVLTPRGGGEWSIDFFGNPQVVTVDGAGHVAGVSGAETTMKIEVHPATIPDLSSLASDYASRDARGEGMGTASPQALARLDAGGPRLDITYSRPAMRGRSIWGGLVPFGEVWRTGANAATHVTIDRDLRIGNLDVPRGTYTLWSIYTPDGGELIVNRDTRIWGTAYDPAHDLGRTPLSRTRLTEPVERFTISIEGTEQGGILHLSWDRTRFSVPFHAR